ncbi:MAG: HlyD family efflux transporter periplasmic adaptor subunit [Planctomycetota bacterium]|jgi:putative peptide zinc metalloprotease protein
MSVAAPPEPQAAIKLKMRGDLSAVRQLYQGVEYWVVKEPLGQKFYQFPPNVYYILQQLDGQTSVEQVLDRYHKQFAPKRLDRDQLQQLLQRFHKDGLVVSEVSGQGTELLRRGRKAKWMERLSSLSNILAIRFRGFDPEAVLNFLNRWVGWIFSPAFALGIAVLGLVAAGSVIVNWTDFQARLPGFEQFFDPRKWWLFALVLAGTKICHEFGHGLACRRFGGECHEIGVMLLVFTPCLYCNVSDSWRMPNKWHRAIIGAAGMYVELILATLATFVWWFAEPGVVRDVCLQVMLIASVSTVLFNGNPLLRFDGYYIVSDLLEIPNLHQRSAKALSSLLGRYWLGLPPSPDPLLPQNRMWAFAAFTVLAFVYRIFIMVSIFLFLHSWLKPYGLEAIGQAIALFSLLGLVGFPLYRLIRFLTVPGRMMQIKKGQFAIATAIIATVVGSILFIPWPHYLRCRVLMIPNRLETIYAREGGTIRELMIRPGSEVAAGQVLAQLENLDLALELEQNRGALLEVQHKRELAQRAANVDTLSNIDYLREISALNSEAEELRKRIVLLQSRIGALRITSPIAGSVVATPMLETLPGEVDLPLVDRQPVVSGAQVGYTLSRGERLCEVADFTNWRAVILLQENQIDFVHVDQAVRIRLHSAADKTIEAKVGFVGVSDRLTMRQQREETIDTMQQRIRVPDLVSELVARMYQEEIQYFAEAVVDPKGLPLKVGIDGQCRLYAGNRSLAARLWWWFNANFGT